VAASRSARAARRRRSRRRTVAVGRACATGQLGCNRWHRSLSRPLRNGGVVGRCQGGGAGGPPPIPGSARGAPAPGGRGLGRACLGHGGQSAGDLRPAAHRAGGGRDRSHGRGHARSAHHPAAHLGRAGEGQSGPSSASASDPSSSFFPGFFFLFVTPVLCWAMVNGGGGSETGCRQSRGEGRCGRLRNRKNHRGIGGVLCVILLSPVGRPKLL